MECIFPIILDNCNSGHLFSILNNINSWLPMSKKQTAYKPVFLSSSSAFSSIQLNDSSMVVTTEPNSRMSCTHRLDEDVADGLALMPVINTADHLLQKELVVLQDFRDLIEHLVHQRRITEWRVLRLFQWLHVALQISTQVAPV